MSGSTAKLVSSPIEYIHSAMASPEPEYAEAIDVNPNVLPVRRTRADELAGQVERLLSRMRIAVIYGGDKTEDGAVIYKSHNPRSWKSYQTVAEDIAASLRRMGCRYVSLMADDMRLAQRLQDEGIHFAWLNTGGVQGFCSVSHAPAILEMLGVPYLGHDPLMAGILDSKHTFKRQLMGLGLPTAEFMTWHGASGPLNPSENPEFKRAFGDYKGPFIVKPVSGRASLNVEFVGDTYGLAPVAREIFDLTQNHVLIERYLGGREYCVAACGPTVARNGQLDKLDGPFTFAAVERVLQDDERIFTSMDKRPITGKRVRALDPAKDGQVINQLNELARRVFTELNMETLVRLDVRADENGRLFVLETNPKPDLKAPTEDGVTSLIAEGLAECGMSYDDLILSLIADRVDLLLRQRRGSAGHLVELLTICEA